MKIKPSSWNMMMNLIARKMNARDSSKRFQLKKIARKKANMKGLEA